MAERKTLEFLKTGHITLPRPAGEAETLKMIRSGEMYGGDFDWHGDLIAWADRLRQKTAPESLLPKNPSWDKVNELCVRMLWDHMSRSERPQFRRLFK